MPSHAEPTVSVASTTTITTSSTQPPEPPQQEKAQTHKQDTEKQRKHEQQPQPQQQQKQQKQQHQQKQEHAIQLHPQPLQSAPPEIVVLAKQTLSHVHHRRPQTSLPAPKPAPAPAPAPRPTTTSALARAPASTSASASAITPASASAAAAIAARPPSLYAPSLTLAQIHMMGCLCGGKPDADGFSSPGRVLGTAPPQGPRTSSVPKNFAGGHRPGAASISGAQALGSAPPATAAAATTTPAPAATATATATAGTTAPEANDARQRAAEAAKRRASAPKFKGKLGAQLDAQQKKSGKTLLAEASHDAVRARQLDAAAETLRHE